MGNFLDKAIAWISPEAGYRREIYRQALRERGYDAADHSRLNSNWRASNESAETTDRYSRDTLRARARDLERNSDATNAVISAHKRNVYGAGYRLRVKTGDEDINSQIEKLWKKWCKARNCDVTGVQSLNEMMRMAVQRKKVDGGILILKRYTKDGIIPLQLQCIEVDELDTNYMVPRNKENKVVGGIEYNSYNKAIGYFVSTYNIDGTINTEPIYVEAKDVIFWYTKKRPTQIREVSDLSQTLTRIRDLNEFIKAVSVKERILACLSVFIKRTQPQPGLGVGGRGVRSEDGTRYDYNGKTVSPGMIMNLNEGDDVETVNPSGQASDATAFSKQHIRMIAAGQGLSYETVSRDMSESNYSSARQVAIEDELTYGEDSEHLIDILTEIYESFVISCVLSGKVIIKDFWENKDDYLKHKWIKAPKKWIDPKKEAESNEVALRTGQKSWADLAAEQGRDWKELMDEISEIIEYGNEKGIDMKEVMFGANRKRTEEK